MGLVKYGAGIVQISGSIAGDVHARNRFGNYIRPRTKPVNPNSSRQQTVRARLQLLTEEWNVTLTAANRLSWDTYADAIAMQNRLGETIHVTGFNHFIRSNMLVLQAGESMVAAGPSQLTLPSGDPVFACALSAASGITVTFDDTLAWCDENDAHMIIDIGQPQGTARTFFAGPYRFDSSIEGNSVTPPTSPTGPTASSTWTLIQGHVCWCRACILRADGRVSNKFYDGPITVGA